MKPDSPAIAAGYEHGEAFCHMRYGSKDSGTWMTVWNSRDGVTPFGMRHPRTGEDITHLPPWSADIFDPFHVPQVGEYVWIDLDPEKAMQLAVEKVEHFWDDPSYPLSERGWSKQEAAAMFLDIFLYTTMPDGTKVESHTPDLVQVTEPLQDRIAAEVKERFEKRAPRFIPAGSGRFA